jgi:hypothetical protein
MDLVGYLNKYHTTVHTDGMSELLVSHFREKFGVVVKQEGNLFQFKYHMIEAKWTLPLTHKCRGVIVKYNIDGTWEYRSRPFDKFFNQHEGYSPVFDQRDFANCAPRMCSVEKADGTCIQVWWDPGHKKWRISTLGTITTLQIQDSDLTFDGLFRETVKDFENSTLFKNDEAKEHTWIFELCCEDNRILTKYESDRAFLIGVRHTEHGTFANDEIMDEYVASLWTEGYTDIVRPSRIWLSKIGIKELDQAIQWIESEAKKIDIYGEYPEGFVIYMDGKPLCKMKNVGYLQLHHVSGGDNLRTRNVIIESVLRGTIDDIQSALSVRMKTFADRCRQVLIQKQIETQKAVEEVASKEYETQKAFAMAVQQTAPKNMWAFFFKNKDKILADSTEVPDMFYSWMFNNYAKYIDDFKKEK